MKRILLLLILSSGMKLPSCLAQSVYNVYAVEPSGILVSPNTYTKPNTATIRSGQTIQLTGFYDQGIAKWYGEGLPAEGSPFFSTFITPVNTGSSNITLTYTVNNNATNAITVTVLPQQAPSHPTVLAAAYCTPNPVLTATGCNGEVKWYQRQGDGGPQPYTKEWIPGAVGATYQTSSTGFFTATCTVNGTESFGSFLTSVGATGVQPSIGILPPASGNQVCMWSSQTLVASGTGLDAGTLTWYEKIGTEAATAIGSETTKNVQVTNLNTQYYAQLAVPGCAVKTSSTQTFTVKPPTTLAASGERTFTVHAQPYDGLTGQNVLGDDNCQLIARFMPNQNWDGVDVTTGKRITVKVSKDNSVKVHNNQPYVQRHYDFEPENPSETQNAWYQVVLYFTQAEFDAFNLASTVKLPLNPADAENYASNLRIWQAHGTPNSLPAAPGNYESIAEACVPCTSIAWDSGLSVWKVTHNSRLGFSGFFVTAENALPLPVTLTHFSARKQENAIALQWQTTEETNSDRFEIQHSTNGKQWTQIGSVATLGDGKILQHYTYTHDKPYNGENLYRLKMVDRDGSFAYSRIASVVSDGFVDIEVFPNPASRRAIIRSVVSVTGYQLLSAGGQRISEIQNLDSKNTEVDLCNTPPGLYILRLSLANDRTEHLKLVVD